MNRRICIFIGSFAAAIAWAQSNAPRPAVGTVAATNVVAHPAASRDFGITSDHGHFDGTSRQLIYTDHVVFTNSQMTLMCERFTVDFPEEGAADSHPNRGVAETNVDVVYLDKHGKTTHLTADKGVYTYNIDHGVTNELITFTGHCIDTVNGTRITGEPMIWNNITRDLYINNISMVGKAPGTNGSPFNFEK